MAHYEEKDSALMRIVKYLIPWEGDKPAEKIRKLIFIAAAVVLVVTVSILVINGVNSAKDKHQNDSLASLYSQGSSSTDSNSTSSNNSSSSDSSSSTTSDTPSSTDSSSSSSDPYAEDPNASATIQSSFEELLAINSDIVGWISIGSWLNLPVMQSYDNEYYLTHDFNNNPSKTGTLYVDYHDRVTSNGPANTVIYGHNDAGAVYFGGLPNYFNYSLTTGDPENISFYKENPTVTYNTIYKNSTYKIFGGILTNVEEEDGSVFAYHTVRKFGSKSDFDNYVANILDRSTFLNPDVDIQYGDKLLTLSTCMWGYGTPSISASPEAHLRWVIFAREVRDGEDPSVDVSKAYANPDPLFFDAYYNNYAGGSWGGRKWPKELIKDFAG